MGKLGIRARAPTDECTDVRMGGYARAGFSWIPGRAWVGGGGGQRRGPPGVRVRQAEPVVKRVLSQPWLPWRLPWEPTSS